MLLSVLLRANTSVCARKRCDRYSVIVSKLISDVDEPTCTGGMALCLSLLAFANPFIMGHGSLPVPPAPPPPERPPSASPSMGPQPASQLSPSETWPCRAWARRSARREEPMPAMGHRAEEPGPRPCYSACPVFRHVLNESPKEVCASPEPGSHVCAFLGKGHQCRACRVTLVRAPGRTSRGADTDRGS